MLGIVGLVLGLLSAILPFVWMVTSWWFAWVLGVAGIVLSVMGMKQLKAANQSTAIAIAGLVVSIIGTVIALGYFVCIIACYSAAGALTSGVGDFLSSW